MIEKRNILISILCIILLIGASRVAAPEVRVYPHDISIAFEYDDNVTRERLKENFQYGIISRLATGFGIKDFIPLKGLNTEIEYDLGLRDVNTTNDEDYSSQKLALSSDIKLKTGTLIFLRDEFKLWNSKSDLFNFYDNVVNIGASQLLVEGTTTDLLYENRQKRFRNDVPEVQARNFLHHQVGVNMYHALSSALTAQVGYAYRFIIYNRSPIDFSGDRVIALDGSQKDRQNIITLGFRGFFPNRKVTLRLQNQFVRSDSNSRAFDFDGNKVLIMLHVGPFWNLSANFTYRLVAYNLEAQQTPETGYELTEPRSDDQSGITFDLSYRVSDQVLLELGYERVENTVFFTREFYEENIFRTGLKVDF
ncbi:hypothetical protein ACFL6S_20480 [Candidatus Poribacteria bacterium]